MANITGHILFLVHFKIHLNLALTNTTILIISMVSIPINLLHTPRTLTSEISKLR